MGFRRIGYDIRNNIGMQWLLHRRLFLWLLFFMCVGICIGIVFLFNPLLTPKKISQSLIDININNVVGMNSGIGKILISRIFDLFIAFLFVFIICLNSWTALLVFPLLAFRGFWLVINLYWIIAKFGFISGLILFICYLFFLIVIALIFTAAVIFIMKHCAQIRRYGFVSCNWGDFYRVTFIFLLIVLTVALMEWLVYLMVLSKIIFLI